MDSTPESLHVEFVRYNTWANLRLLDVCQALTEDQLHTAAPGTYGTIYDTLVHTIRAEGLYYRLLTDQRISPAFNWDDHKPSLAELRDYAIEIGDRMLALVTTMTPDSEAVDEWQDGETKHQAVYKGITMLIQLVNHGVEHRTNVTTIMSQLGLTTPEVDGWGYLWGNTDRLVKRHTQS